MRAKVLDFVILFLKFGSFFLSFRKIFSRNGLHIVGFVHGCDTLSYVSVVCMSRLKWIRK